MMKKVMALVMAMSMMVGLSMAQDDGTYIDNFGPKDSSYAQTDLLDFDDEVSKSEGGTPWALIGGIAVVVVVGAVLILRKKKK